jgi:HSP20 family protein
MAYRGGITAIGGFGSLFSLRREIDRLFDEMYGVGGRATWTPSANVRESKDDVVLEMELPGVDPEHVEINIENDMLTVSGEKREERREGEEEGRYFLLERSYGSFSRSFSLPQGIDPDQVKASFDNGLLTIRIPRAALPQPRRVQITSGKSGEIRGGREEGRAATTRAEGGRTRTGTREGSMAASGPDSEENR